MLYTFYIVTRLVPYRGLTEFYTEISLIHISMLVYIKLVFKGANKKLK